MDEFDLGRLTDYDFEKVCKDIFEDHLQVQLELFTPGADGGVDLRHYCAIDDTTVVIQCKHWIKSGSSKLIRHYETHEAEKVARLAPSRYLLATTAELTPAAKARLVTVLQGYLQSTGDIFGLNEIVAFLESRPNIVTRHLRLWLTSAAVLRGIFNRDIQHRSQALAEDIEESLRTFVTNANYDDARVILEREHACIISGLPGIGKSTLAHVLAASYVAEGFTLVEATEQLSDINRFWDNNEPQVFFVDDFLGQTVLNESKANAASVSLSRLLRSVKKSSNKRVILTTREYVVAQAQERYDKLAHFNFNPRRCTLDVASYTDRIRATILYNHIFFSGLPYEQRARFADSSVYKKIITHPNYSPRIIEHAITQATSCSDDHGSDAVKAVLDNLANPRRLWELLIEEVLSQEEISLVLVVYSMLATYSIGSRPRLSAVEVAWRSHAGLADSPQVGRAFRRCLKRLQDTMLRVLDVNGQDKMLEFHNPSIQDFMHAYIGKHPEVLRSVIAGAVYFDQVRYLWQVAQSRNGHDILMGLERERSLLGEVTETLIGARLFIGKNKQRLAARLICIVGITELVRSPRLIEYCEGLLADEKSWTEYLSPDEMVRLVRILRDTTAGQLRSYRTRVAIVAGPKIVADAWDWETVLIAEELLENLGEMAPANCTEDLEYRKLEAASDVLDEWTDGEPSNYVDEHELEQVLDWMEESGEYHSGFDSAYEYLRREESDTVTKPVSRRSSTADESAEIPRMLSGLRRRPNAD